MRGLALELKVGERVSIDRGKVIVTLEEKSGQRARLRFEADNSVKIEKVNGSFRTGASQASAGVSLSM